MKLLQYGALLFIACSLSAKQGCVSNRAGVNNSKRVSAREVTCYCHCDRYPHSERRNTCANCGHANVSDRFEVGRGVPAKQPWELLGME